MAEIEDSIQTIESIFEQWKTILGTDYSGYKNHVYRVVHFCVALYPGNSEEKEMFSVAGCFHDIGIWTNKTFDYLDPSVELAKIYLNSSGKTEWSIVIELMIRFHHKITHYRDTKYPLVDIFRRADWIDLTKGKRSFGLPNNEVKTILDTFPNNGFHEKLVKLTKAEFRKNPLNPLPMMKW